MNFANKNTSILSISSKKIKNCNELLSYFYKLKIPCSITENNSIVKYGNDVKTERGCRILFNSHEPEMINRTFWIKLKKKYDLQCAHLNVKGKFKGCINDYLKNSDCTTFENN